MFTGIIQHTSAITTLQTQADIVFVSCITPENWNIEIGESIAINGVCSTVARKNDTEFTVEYMPETLRKTTVSQWGAGGVYNLEKSLRVGDSLNGHFVMGHIDTVGIIANIFPEGDSQMFEVTLPHEFLRYIAYKGSVSLDGISLTVSSVTENTFSVSLIPYTLTHTNLYQRRVGDTLNIETDILAKYLLK